MSRFSTLLLIVSVTSGAMSTAQAQERSTRVAAILVGTTNLRGAQADVRNIELLLTQSVKAFNKEAERTGRHDQVVRFSPYPKIIDGQTDAKVITDMIDNMQMTVGDDTTLIFYYAGHGATIRDENGANQHVLFLDDPNRPLKRSSVLTQMELRKPRLLILLTDCCTNYFPSGAPIAAGLGDRVGLFEDLFLLPKGSVDATSAQFGQGAWGDVPGGHFTLALVDEYYPRREPALQRPVTWKNYFNRVSQGTNDRFQAWQPVILGDPFTRMQIPEQQLKDLDDQREQVPMAFPSRPEAPDALRSLLLPP